MEKANLGKKKILIISHVFASGPAQALLEYLTKKNIAEKVLFIGHPLFFQKNKEFGSFFEVYKKGKKTFSYFTANKKIPPLVGYFKDILQSFWWTIKTKEKWDIIVCADCLNAFTGILLKKLGKARKVVFYTVDYVPKRFNNQILNYFYHLIDKFSVHNSDSVWNLSPRMSEARKKIKKITTPPGKQKIVPMGIWLERNEKNDISKKSKTLVFMGHLLEKQGVQYVIDAIPKIIKEVPDFKFLIIGTGPFESVLKKMTNDKKVEKYVEFTGYIKELSEVGRKMSNASCAIALYEKGNLETNFTYYADPGKIKDYLGAGLPVILSDVPHNARELEKRKCGIIADDFSKLGEIIINLFKNQKKLDLYRKNAHEYAKEFDWEKIYKNTFTGLV